MPTWEAALAPWRLGTATPTVAARLASAGVSPDAVAALGQAHDARHRAAWCAEALPADADDRRAQAVWTSLLAGDLSTAGVQAARRHVARPVRDAFRALGRGLGLPGHVVEHQAALAVDALDGLVLGAHAEIVARGLECGSPPVAALVAALGLGARARVDAAVAARPDWADACAMAGGASADLVRAVDVHLVLATADAPAPGDPPGWSSLKARHDRLRGRLRAVLAAHPDELAVAWATASSARARLDRGARRWAWAWAWREARSGFAFDVDAMTPAPCAPTPPAVSPPALPSTADDAVRAWLLVVLGRGQSTALERWVDGAGGRDLPTGFYRYLAEAPDTLADPGSDGRSRSYVALRLHLADGGLESAWAALRPIAARLRALDPGPGLRERVADTLAPVLAGTGVAMPAHHLTRFVARMDGLLGP